MSKVHFPYESDDYDRQKFGFGYSPDDIDVCMVCEGLPLETEWRKFTIEMRYGIFPDYLITDLNIPLCSGKMKNIIARNCRNSSDIHWLPVDVRHGNSVVEYYILHIPHYIADVIDLEKSDRDKDVIFSPHFRQELIEDKDIFASEDDTTTVYFSQRLKDTLEKENLSGLGFESWESS
ncbi:MAG: hypothetical protein LBV47_02725 [Bacteroidales bacterium]|jgi:hypothetical protein|nr:hypothetical protein [Bacteroidales bacterium]